MTTSAPAETELLTAEVAASTVDRRQKTKAWIAAYLGGKCHRCGWNEHHASLVAHHVNPTKKSFAVAKEAVFKTQQELVRECNKCILLCHNCHAIVHATNEAFYFDEGNIPDYEALVGDVSQTNRCLECDAEVSLCATRCSVCNGRRNAVKGVRRQIVWPALDVLENMLTGRTASAVAKDLGVTSGAFSKHIRTARKQALASVCTTLNSVTTNNVSKH